MQKRLLAILMAFGLIAAACGSSTDTVTDAAADVAEEVTGEDEAMEDEAMEDEAMEDEDAMEDVSHDLNLEQNADFGQILTDEGGYTVYLFSNDTQGAGTSACEDGCLEVWPAVGEITSPSGALDADLVGSIERSDGTIQATYNGWPLYRFASDESPTDTNGQGVNDVWWVIGADGEAVAA